MGRRTCEIGDAMHRQLMLLIGKLPRGCGPGYCLLSEGCAILRGTVEHVKGERKYSGFSI